MGTILIILIAVLYGLLIAGGLYLKSYFTEKGKNLATKEDFKDLKAQTAELTQTTKEIEARISDEAWDRQKQWELTRDAVIKLIEAGNKLDDAGIKIASIHGKMQGHEADNLTEADMKAALESWMNERKAMIDVLTFVDFVCWTDETSKAFWAYLWELTNVPNPEDALIAKIAKSCGTWNYKFGILRDAIRKELRLHDKESQFSISMPQSSGSSAAPSPGSPNPE